VSSGVGFIRSPDPSSTFDLYVPLSSGRTPFSLHFFKSHFSSFTPRHQVIRQEVWFGRACHAFLSSCPVQPILGLYPCENRRFLKRRLAPILIAFSSNRSFPGENNYLSLFPRGCVHLPRCPFAGFPVPPPPTPPPFPGPRFFPFLLLFSLEGEMKKQYVYLKGTVPPSLLPQLSLSFPPSFLI